MDISPAHAAARAAAARLPALAASLALLQAEPGPATIALYATTRPAPGEAPGGDPLVVVPFAAGVGTLDEDNHRIVATVPIEAQITTSGNAVWARIVDGAGAWWSDASVSDDQGSGEIQLANPDAALYAGAFCRITSAVFQG